MLNILFALIGLLTGALINVLADDLPDRARPRPPHCPQCDHPLPLSHWLAVGQWLWGGRACPHCGLATRSRNVAVELGTAALFALLPSVVAPELGWVTLAIVAFYQAVFILVIVIDVEHRLILHIVTFPTTLLAIGLSEFLANNGWRSAAVGAVAGFVVFYIFFLIGQMAFGPGALGFGDVTLSMTMGAMLGFKLILLALVLGILIGGVLSVLLIVSGRVSRHSYVPYGPFLALAGMVMVVWGEQIFQWYLG
jgi:prepilin signal peptidase PulO-like enzyme (type II secretory pathway)